MNRERPALQAPRVDQVELGTVLLLHFFEGLSNLLQA
jgi:hypothetical protein